MRNCLIVDDDPGARNLAKRLLRHHGFRTILVDSGEAAIAALKHRAFELALVDLTMPQVSGHEVIREFRMLAAGMKILVVSGYDDPENVMAALENGADGYVVKDEFAQTIERVLYDLSVGRTAISARVRAVIEQHVAGKLRVMRAAEAKRPPLPRREKPASLTKHNGVEHNHFTHDCPVCTAQTRH